MILLMLMIVATAFFTGLKESSSPELAEDIESIEESTTSGLMFGIWAIGIIGTIGVVFGVINYLKSSGI